MEDAVDASRSHIQDHPFVQEKTQQERPHANVVPCSLTTTDALVIIDSTWKDSSQISVSHSIGASVSTHVLLYL